MLKRCRNDDKIKEFDISNNIANKQCWQQTARLYRHVFIWEKDPFIHDDIPTTYYNYFV